MVNEKHVIRPLSEALRKKAEEELNETPEKLTTALKELRKWIEEQPHLHSVRPTNQWLVAFLRGCKYDLEKAKKKVDMYYKFKATLPDYFGNRNPFDPKIQEMLKIGGFLPLRKLESEDSARVCLSRTGAFSTTKLPISDYMKLCIMIIEICLLEDDNFAISGNSTVADLEGMAFGLILSYTPLVAKRTLNCIEGALSVRIRSIHILNPIFGLQTALAIMKMFMSAKIKNRIHVYEKEPESLHDIDKSTLPKEYGGTDGTLQELIDYWKGKVESYSEWFMDETSCSDESKRPQKRSWFYS